MAKPPVLGFATHRSPIPFSEISKVPAKALATDFHEKNRIRILLENIQFHENMTDKLANETYIVSVNEASAVLGGADKPCIGTTKLSSCVGIALYDPQHGVAAVTHVLLGPFFPSVGPVAEMLSRLFEVGAVLGGSYYSAIVFNAHSGHRTWNEGLVSYIDTFMGSLVRTGTLRSLAHREETNFIMDSRDGSIYTGLS